MAHIADDAAAIAARVKELEQGRTDARKRSEENGGAGGALTGGAGNTPAPAPPKPEPGHYGHYSYY